MVCFFVTFSISLRDANPVIAVLYPSTLSHSIANVANPRPLVRGRCLWDIPGEVRNLIYSSVLTELPRRINVARDRSSCSGTQNPDTGYITPQFPFANCLPGIAYTCKQVYQEFVSLYLARAKFELTTMEDVWYFEGFLNTVPWGCGWHAVAHLVFPDFGRLAETPARANEVMDFCRRTPDLGHLELVLNLNGLYLPPIREDSDQINFLRRMRPMKPAEQFALEMDLRSLFDMPNLHTLTVRYRHDGITCTPMNMSAFMDLRDWLISGFVATPGVEVSHEYVDFPRSRDSYITLRISRPDRRASDLQSCGASEASSDALVF